MLYNNDIIEILIADFLCSVYIYVRYICRLRLTYMTLRGWVAKTT